MKKVILRHKGMKTHPRPKIDEIILGHKGVETYPCSKIDEIILGYKRIEIGEIILGTKE